MQQARPRFTVEEYFATEATSEVKHEFYQGEMVAMTGASLNHNRIVTNLSFALTSALRGTQCEVFVADMRLRLREHVYVYPDVTVACGAIQLTADPLDTLSNPTVVIEVLSKSTENYDRGLKSRLYRTIGSLTDYVLVEQDQSHVEHLHRAGEGEWVLRERDSLSDVLRLTSVGAEIPLSDIYQRVEFSASDETSPQE
jgi:Uma2 family endonuclease